MMIIGIPADAVHTECTNITHACHNYYDSCDRVIHVENACQLACSHHLNVGDIWCNVLGLLFDLCCRIFET